VGSELPSYGAFLVETLVVLAVVCALAWLILRYGVRRAGIGQRGPLKVLARLPLEPRRTLYIVEAPGKMLLIGAGEGTVSTLAELDAAEVAAALAEPEPRRSLLDFWRSRTPRV